ncbi:C45 family peptidase [Cloacibacillus sp. An23]|uniref:C45 family autoproteolytic acyltransferase/hydolase n=1 Tax=Cloacibacillus sp. An23 TaxID=1965591 RepID=UPI00130218DB|nr:C45 family peptidase [Cloacibacillus sp. An23]
MAYMPFFTIQGRTPRERGADYGSQCRELIGGVLERYMTFFNSGHAAVSWDDAREISKKFLPFIEAYSPELLEELRGVAEGSGASFDDLLTLNSRSEAMTLVRRPASDEEELDGCSSVAVLPEASADGHTILAQNWDTYTWQEYGTVILQVLKDGGADMMIVTEAGQLARYGMNQAGLALGVNSLHKTSNTKVFGVPSVFVRRKFLEQDRYVDAVNKIFGAEAMLPMYYAAAYGAGDAMGFEKLARGQLVLYPENGLISHSNHIKHPKYGYQVDALGGTLYRDRRILRRLAPKAGAITRADIIEAFKDHFGFPFSVCRHGDERKKELDKISTLGCIVMDATDKRLWACKGTPCCGQFREYAWDRPAKLAQWSGAVEW